MSNKIKTPLKHIYYIDFARIYAIAGVVLIHISGNIVVKFHHFTAVQWWYGNIIDSFSRWCIPLFIMISGAVILGSEKTHFSRRYLRKRLSRVALPFAGWLVIYKICEFDISGKLFTFTELAEFVKQSIISFLAGNPFFHLFFLVITGLYLVVPVFNFFMNMISMRILLLCMAAFFVIPCAGGIYYVIFAVDKFTPLCGVPYNCATIWLPFAGYFIAGFYLSKIRIKNSVRIAWAAFFCFIPAGIFTGGGTFFLFMRYGVSNRGLFFYNYLSPFVIVMSVASFIIIRCLHETTVNKDCRKNNNRDISSGSNKNNISNINDNVINRKDIIINAELTQ